MITPACSNRATILFLLVAIGPSSDALAGKSLAGRACRSVHLQYPGAESTAFYNEVMVKRSAPGTYFAVCGWNTGYFGIQEITPTRKVLIFSVWDAHRGDDPSRVPEQKQVKVLHTGKGVVVSRFGGEGTGGKSMFEFAWKPETRYRFLVTAKPNGNRTEYGGFVYLPEQKGWKHLVTFSTLTGGAAMRGYYSFVEDFRRNGESLRHVRRAAFGNGWIRTQTGQWTRLDKARFTADSNPATNIDAGIENEMYFLATGGDTTNEHTKLRQAIPGSADLKFREPELPKIP